MTNITVSSPELSIDVAPAPGPTFSDSATTNATDSSFHWTVGNIFLSLFLFTLAGLAEIGGGWLVWQTIRENKVWWMALLGSLVLVAYGFIPCAQPVDNFGRVYAVYGGFFILFSYLWGWGVDKVKPDTGDWVGTAIAMTGVIVAFFWPR